MAFSCRFLGNLQVAIKNWEYSKIKLAQNYKYWPPLPFFDHVRFTCILFPTYICFSELTPCLSFENGRDVFFNRCIKNSYFTFSKVFSNQTKVVNESISRKY